MKKKIVIAGPILSRSGYGEMARFAFRSLKAKEELFDIYVLPTNWGNTGNLFEETEEKKEIDNLIFKTQHFLQATNNQPNFDISIQVTIPNEWKKIAAYNVGYTAGIETNAISPTWVAATEQMDKVIVISEHAKKGFIEPIFGDAQGNRIKVTTPIDVCHFPVRDHEQVDINLDLKYDFNFLTVCQWGPRKNLEQTILSFIEEFKNEEVGLVLKINTSNDSVMDRQFTEDKLKMLLSGYKDRKCSIHLLHGHMSESEMQALFKHPKIKAVVSTSHGEGFGFPLFEAAYNEKPVIATDWSGHLDFLTMPDDSNKPKKMFAKIDFELKKVLPQHVWAGVIEEQTSWAYPVSNSVKARMREVLKDYGRFKSWSKKLNSWVRQEFTKEKMYDNFFYSLGIFFKSKEKTLKPVDGVSFCISTNGKKIDKTLKSIKSIVKNCEKTAFSNYEINIAGVVNCFEQTDKINLINAEQEANTGKLAKLRNLAAQNAKYENIVFLDDDIVFEEDWLEQFIRHSSTNSWDVLGNKILLPNGDRYWDRATFKPHTMVDYDHPSNDKSLYQTGCFWIIRREVFSKHKWDESIEYYAERQGKINEDIEFSQRLVQNGYELSFDEINTVWHLDGRYSERTLEDGRKVCVKQEFENTFAIKDFSYLEAA